MEKNEKAVEEIKTGYEETPEAQDTYGKIGSDDDIPDITKDADPPQKTAEEIAAEKAAKETTDDPPEKTEEELQKEKDEAEKEKAEAEKAEAEKLAKEVEDDLKVDDDKKEKTDEEIAAEKLAAEKKEDPEKEEDIFDITELKEDFDKEEKVKTATKDLDFIKIAGEIKIDDDIKIEVEENNIESFKIGVKKAIESAKQKTDFDLSKFNEEQQNIIKFIEQNPVKDLIEPLKEFDDVLIMPDEAKLMLYFQGSKGMSEEDAQTKVNELIEIGEADDQVKKINSMLMNNRESAYKEIIENSTKVANKHNSTQQAKAEKETNEMLNVIEETKTFMGLKLKDDVKDYLKLEVKSGKLQEKNNNAETQIKARLFDLFGSKLLKQLTGKIKDSSREGYNKGHKKANDTLHNKPPKTEAKPAVDTKVNEDAVTHPLGGFIGLDSDSIDGV